MTEQTDLARSNDKKKAYDLWEKRQATHEDYKDVIGYARRKSGPKHN